MLGLMQEWGLTLDKIIDHAARCHGHRDVVTRSSDGSVAITHYASIRNRAKQVSNALKAEGIRVGDRVATLAFNSSSHVETWYGIMGIGAVCHTVNPRLFHEQIVYIINHAEDKIILADGALGALLRQVLPHCPTVNKVIFLSEPDLGSHELGGVRYEDWIADQSSECRWGDFTEETAAGLCYTSGTTGNPKGVLYTHRSNYLHTLTMLQADVVGLSATDTVLAVVPMFHANAWGLTFAAPAVGAKLVLPGPKLDGASILSLLEDHGVTVAAAVPTVWQALLHHIDAVGLTQLKSLKKVFIGGAACPESIIRAFKDRFDVEVLHIWGMTEMSPIGSAAVPCARVADMPPDAQLQYRLKQGRSPLGVEMQLMDESGLVLAHDGRTHGQLKVRGQSVSRAYFKGEAVAVLDEGGFFDTGDVATIDEYGYMQITDRVKDVIKSGGEWISSIELENIAVGHPKASLAAVIAMPHPQWGERPLLLVQLKPGLRATRDEFLYHLQGKIAKWWTPDDVVFVASIPLGATGKIDKRAIRQQFRDYRFPDLETSRAVHPPDAV